MTPSTESKPAPRKVSRWITYPVLLFIPIASIYAGIVLGHNDVGSFLMLTSLNQTAVENWILTLSGFAIALFAYVAKGFAIRNYAIRPFTLVLVGAYLLVLFVFGVWGLYALGALGLAWYLARYSTFWRKSQSPPPGDGDDNQV